MTAAFRTYGIWTALGALLGWLAAYPMAALVLWGALGAAPGSETAAPAPRGVFGLFDRLLPVNLISALLGSGGGLLLRRAMLSRRALRESEARFRSMAAAAPEAIILMDARGRVTFWNAAAETMFGYSREEAIGMDLHAALMPPRYREAFAAGHARFAETGRGHAVGRTLELGALRRDGSEFPIELSVAALRLKGRWEAMGIVRDISARKQAEAERLAREKLAGVLEMAGAACHNMNQPLQSALWGLQALREELPEGERMHAELGRVLAQIEKMRAITRKIMAITRYEALDYYQDVKIVDIDKASTKGVVPPAPPADDA
jgi:PAS domain S-box-containing protein